MYMYMYIYIYICIEICITPDPRYFSSLVLMMIRAGFDLGFVASGVAREALRRRVQLQGFHAGSPLSGA